MTGVEIDAVMERASIALTDMRYADCERLCLEAFEAAHQQNDYARLARIVLPLQEARRQRRQAAVDAGVFVLSGPRLDIKTLLNQYPTGCLLLTNPPYTPEDEAALRMAVFERSLTLEPLVLHQADLRQMFEDLLERRGDHVLAGIAREADAAKTVAHLARHLDQFGDHEIAHQRLAEAARTAARKTS